MINSEIQSSNSYSSSYFISISIFYILFSSNYQHFYVREPMHKPMLLSTLGYHRVSKQSSKRMTTDRQQVNSMAKFHCRRPSSAHALTSRTQRDDTCQLSRTHEGAYSSRDKYNNPHTSNDFSILTHPTFTKKPSLSKTILNASKEQFLSQNKTNSSLQRTCVTQSSPSHRSNTDTSKNTKRKKKTQHLFNFTPRNTTKTTRDNNTQDPYILSFISTNKQQFMSTNNSDATNSSISKNEQKPYQQIINDKNNSSPHSLTLKQTNYQKIRQKMKKLKNMTQTKTFKRKPIQYKTTEQEWNQIQKVVRTVCRQHMKRADTEQTLESQLHVISRENIDQMCEKERENQGRQVQKYEKNNDLQDIREDEQVSSYMREEEQVSSYMREEEQVSSYMREEEQVSSYMRKEEQVSSYMRKEEQVVEDYGQIRGRKVQEKSGSKEEEKNIEAQSMPMDKCENKHPSQTTKNPEITQFKDEPVKSQQKQQIPQAYDKPISLSFPQFRSLLLIYEHTLYTVPSIVNKISQICQSYQLSYKQPIFLLFKQMCLNKKLIESLFDQQEDSLFILGGVYDYVDVVRQIKKANASNLKSLEKFRPDVMGKKLGNICNQQSLQLLTGKESMKELTQSIQTMKIDFFLTNMKMIKKLLKRISKNASTNTKQFHSFLNYTSTFLNLTTVHQTIHSTLSSTITLPVPLKNPTLQKQQSQIHEFLYEECKFIENKYLTMKPKVFQMCFDIQEENKRIEKYYRELVGELKGREQIFKSQT